jgi:uncharacterized protein DUF4340
VAEAVKRPPFLGTWIAVLLLGGLGAYIYLVEMKRDPGTPGETKKEKVFAALDQTKVEGVTVAATGQDEVQLVREKDAWRMTAPTAVGADTTEVEGILSTLETLERDAIVTASPSNAAEYGLATPHATVRVRLAGVPEPLGLMIGDKTPDGGSLFARTAASPAVFTIPSFVEGSLVKKPFDLRDRSVLHVKRADVITMDIAGPEGAYSLGRDGDEWWITKPLRTRAGRWSVDGLVGALEGLRMESVAAESATDLKPFGLAPPTRTVTLGLAGGGSRTLEIGSSPAASRHHVRVAGSPLVAVVPGGAVDDLAKGMGSLRAKRLLELSSYEVEGFDVETPEGKKTYARSTVKDEQGTDQHKWKRTAPDSADIDTKKVEDALFAVGGIEAAEFIDAPKPLAAYGLDKPALRVTLRMAGGKPPLWFEIGTKDGATYARREGDAATMMLDGTKAAEVTTAFSVP